MGRTAGYSATKTAAGNIRRSGSSAWSSCPSWVTALWRSAASFAFSEGVAHPLATGAGEDHDLVVPVATNVVKGIDELLMLAGRELDRAALGVHLNKQNARRVAGHPHAVVLV